MLEPDELQNKTWLLCAKGWLEIEKHESFSAAFTSSQLNLLDEFLEKEASLSKYLASLDHWLIKFVIYLFFFFCFFLTLKIIFSSSLSHSQCNNVKFCQISLNFVEF